MKGVVSSLVAVFAVFCQARKFSSKICSLAISSIEKRDVQAFIGQTSESSDQRVHAVPLDKSPSSPISPPFKAFGFFELYIIHIGIGTSPTQVFRAIIDISWTDLFVPSLECDGCKGNLRYDSSRSSTFERNGSASEVHYMGIEGTGFTSLDTITIAEGLQIFHHPFQELGSWYNEMYPWGFVHDSVLGLNIGPPPFLVDGPIPTLPSPFQAMISQGVLDANMFSVKLPSPENDDGEIMFGGYDESAFEGELSTHPIFPPNATQWQIEPKSITLTFPNGSVLMDESLAGNTAILTTAFTYIMFPQRIGNMVMEHVPIIDDDCWICTPCENVPSLPVISLNLGGRYFELKGEDYTVKGWPLFCDRECCFPIIGPNSEDANSTEIVVGTLFLKKLYTVFDWDAKAVHFGSLQSG